MVTDITFGEYDGFTDELCIRFYSCGSCGFEYVPRVNDNDDYTKEFGPHPQDGTARFCPGCAASINWIEKK